MARQWTQESILEVAGLYQPACVLAAAAELDLFGHLGQAAATAESLADRCRADLRATTVILDALAAIGLLTKTGPHYAPAPGVLDVLTEDGPQTALAMVRHRANCLRRWAQLAAVAKSGRPAERTPSIRGPEADQAAFIGAMHNISGPAADALVAQLRLPPFRHLLDIGGASGTWTIALLRLAPEARATLFDLPEVIPLARSRLAAAGLTERVACKPGDFYVDDLPPGADLAWLSAIAHQNSREQNRALYRKIHKALAPGGSVVIRDVVMDATRTSPPGGAMFAVNMLVATEGGGTYTLDEYRADLETAGFTAVSLLRQDPLMNSFIIATRAECQQKPS